MDEIFLYPGIAPGSENISIEEKTTEEDWKNGLIKRCISGVTKPSLIPFFPEKPNGAAVIIIPGGGYKRLVISHEGKDIANWLNSMGITAFILKHRLPVDGHLGGLNVPLQDAQRAIRLIRNNAERFKIEPNKIGVIGFSAGGHVASMLGTSFDKKVYAPFDAADTLSARPDFMILVYPSISQNPYVDLYGETPEHPSKHVKNSEEFFTNRNITSNTPQTFLIVADDDKTAVSENCIAFYLGLRKVNVPAEMHIYKKGRHGFGYNASEYPVAGWTKLCEDWLEEVIS